MQASRIPTGIEGLDPLIEGGFVRGDMHLVAGGPGTGKTIFATGFAANAISQNEKVVYATFEESAEYLMRNVKKVGIDLDPLRRSGGLRLLELDAFAGKQLDSSIKLLVSAMRDSKSSILIIDSLTALLLATESKFEARSFMDNVYKTLKKEGVTSLFTISRSVETGFGVEAFVADSVLLLENWSSQDQFKTRFLVVKMRGTEHSRRYHSVSFSPNMAILKYM